MLSRKSETKYAPTACKDPFCLHDLLLALTWGCVDDMLQSMQGRIDCTPVAIDRVYLFVRQVISQVSRVLSRTLIVGIKTASVKNNCLASG